VGIRNALYGSISFFNLGFVFENIDILRLFPNLKDTWRFKAQIGRKLGVNHLSFFVNALTAANFIVE